MEAQEQQLQVTRTAKMVKDVHKFIETLLGDTHEDDAQAYCREATKLGYGTLDYIQKKNEEETADHNCGTTRTGDLTNYINFAPWTRSREDVPKGVLGEQDNVLWLTKWHGHARICCQQSDIVLHATSNIKVLLKKIYSLS